MTSLVTDALEATGAAGHPLLDLTVRDPSRCGLAWSAAELAALVEAGRPLSAEAAAAAARDAVASYLAGHGAAVAPGRVVLGRSRRQALRAALSAICGEDGEVLVPSPDGGAADLSGAVRCRPYALRFEGRWRIDRRSLQRALGARTRAVLAGNPAEPTGAALSGEELAFLADRCAATGAVLVADESRLDTTLDPGRSVAAAGALAVHVSGLEGICGLAGLEVEWSAVTGPERSARTLASAIAARATAPGAGVACVAPLLARREEFLKPLRARLSRNRSALASSSLGEAPWTLLWGGGWWAVLQVNSTQDGDALALALLERGIAVPRAHEAGLPRQAHLVLSLLPAPEIFDAALERIERCLRRPP